MFRSGLLIDSSCLGLCMSAFWSEMCIEILRSRQKGLNYSERELGETAGEWIAGWIACFLHLKLIWFLVGGQKVVVEQKDY